MFGGSHKLALHDLVFRRWSNFPGDTIAQRRQPIGSQNFFVDHTDFNVKEEFSQAPIELKIAQ